MSRDFDEFLSSVTSYTEELEDSESKQLQKAYKFGRTAHKGQLRANGQEYFTEHCVPVALHLAEIGMGVDMITAGLLHDTIEDTDTTNEDIQREFNPTVAELVEGVSKLGKIKYRGYERHVESLRKFFVAVADDVRVVIVKLCDRWHNLETLEFLPPEKQERIAKESMLVHGHLASRLAMGKLTSTINDLAFPYADPDNYKKTKDIRDENLGRSDKVIESMYRDCLSELTTMMGYNPQIDRRQKGLYSLFKKLERKDWNIDEVYDLIALRIIVNTEAECYQALGAIHGKWRPVLGRVKDYIAVPKPNGYQSLHTAVFSGSGPIVEIQIRTQAMHRFAEFGVAAHHSYKKSFQEPTKSKHFDWVQQLGELRTDTRTPDEYLQELRVDFFHDRIFALTPEGDVIDLPAGATALDFAFAVHSELGLSAQGAKINGAYKALKTTLASEDIVEVVTAKNVQPKRDWLEWTVTNLAHSKIRNKLGLQRPFRAAKNS